MPNRALALPALRTEYGSVAFVRRRQVVCSIGVDAVEVYAVEVDPDEAAPDRRHGCSTRPPAQMAHRQELEQLGALDYPLDAWDYPGGERSATSVSGTSRVFAILAVPQNASRRR